MPFENSSACPKAIHILQTASFAAKLSGRPLDDELQGLVDRAIEGNTSIDLEKLARRVNEALPNTSATSPTA